MATNARSIHFQRLERECDYDDLPKLYELESWGWQVLFLNHAYVLLHSNSGRSYDGLQDAPAVIAKVKDILGEVEPAAPEEPQVPADLAAKGWEILTTDIGFRCENQAASLRTLAWGTPELAFEAARELQLAHDEGLVGTRKQTVVETGAETPAEVEKVIEPAAEQEAEPAIEAEPEAEPESPVEMPAELALKGWALTEAGGNWQCINEISGDKTLTVTDPETAIACAQELQLMTETAQAGSAPQQKVAAQSEVQDLSVELIRTDGGTQPRTELSIEVVDQYADKLYSSADYPFPPLVAFFDESDYWLADGFHRLAAVKKEGLDLIPVEVRPGTRRDAVLYSVGANATHGLPRTNADKRRAVLILLQDEEWAAWSDGMVAKAAEVTQPFVSKLRRELTQNGFESHAERKGKDGRVIDTKNIGHEKEPEPALAFAGDAVDEGEEVEQAETEATPAAEHAPVVMETKPVDSRLPAHYREPEPVEAASAIEAPEETHTAEATIIPEHIAAIDPAAVSDLWSKAIITLTVQYMPGANGDRKVLIGASNDGDAPIFASTSESALGKLPGPMIEVLMKLADDLPRRAEAKAALAAKPAAKQASKPKAPAKKASKAAAKKPAARKSDKKATARA
jgi:hypothetical protein